MDWDNNRDFDETAILTLDSKYVDESAVTPWENSDESKGDGGYLDTFRYLKKQMDYNYKQYKDQLRGLVKREDKLRSDRNWALGLFIAAILIPVIYMIVHIALVLASDNTTVYVVTTYVGTFFKAIMFVIIFIAIPITMRSFLTKQRQYSIMMGSKRYEGYCSRNDIITFADEKRFLKNRIIEFDKFYENVSINGWDRIGGDASNESRDFARSYSEVNENIEQKKNETQERIIEDMRRMSMFKEYRASSLDGERALGIGWLYVCILVLVCAMMLYLALSV